MKIHRVALLAGFLFHTVYSDTTRHDICINKTRIISYNGNEQVNDSWILQPQNCSFNKSALLLRLSKMELKHREGKECEGELKISGFSGNLCKKPKYTCFLLAFDGWQLNNSYASECVKVFWIPKYDVLPLAVSYLKDCTALKYRFEITYTYFEYRETTDATQGTETEVADKHTNNDSSRGAAIALGVLSTLEAVALFVLAVCYFLRERNNLNVVSEKTPSGHTHATPTEKTQATTGNNTHVTPAAENTYEMVEKQVVVNELYTMT